MRYNKCVMVNIGGEEKEKDTEEIFETMKTAISHKLVSVINHRFRKLRNHQTG